MDACGQIHMDPRGIGQTLIRLKTDGLRSVFGRQRNDLARPIFSRSRLFDLAEDLRDVDGLAAVAANVFCEALHCY